MGNDEWYALQVRTGAELDVRDSLVKKGFKALCPRRMIKERKLGEWRNIIKTLFPGYVLVHCEMTPEEYYEISNTPLVINILRGANPNFPTPIPQDEMEIVLGICRDDDFIGISEVLLEGENIKVLNGSLVGYEGQIIEVKQRQNRVKVRFSLAGQEKKVELGIKFVEKTDKT